MMTGFLCLLFSNIPIINYNKSLVEEVVVYSKLHQVPALQT